MNDYLDLKYDLVCAIAKETIRQLNSDTSRKGEHIDFDFDVDYSQIESEVSKEIDEIIEKIKML